MRILFVSVGYQNYHKWAAILQMLEEGRVTESVYRRCALYCPYSTRHSIRDSTVYINLPSLKREVQIRRKLCFSLTLSKAVPEFIDPRFRDNKSKTLVFNHRKRAFRACFRKTVSIISGTGEWAYENTCQKRQPRNRKQVATFIAKRGFETITQGG
jgi:hypothetical protein